MDLSEGIYLEGYRDVFHSIPKCRKLWLARSGTDGDFLLLYRPDRFRQGQKTGTTLEPPAMQ